MSRQWRWSLVAVIVAAVVGSFMPTSVLDIATPVRDGISTLSAEMPPTAPNGCFIASCGKGTPVPAAPVLTLAGLAAVTVAALSLAVLARRRRTVSALVGLPRGVALPLFHPPQFS
jgi:hypothetical protein